MKAIYLSFIIFLYTPIIAAAFSMTPISVILPEKDIYVCPGKKFYLPVEVSHELSDAVIVQPDFKGAAEKFLVEKPGPKSLGQGTTITIEFGIEIPQKADLGRYDFQIVVKLQDADVENVTEGSLIIDAECPEKPLYREVLSFRRDIGEKRRGRQGGSLPSVKSEEKDVGNKNIYILISAFILIIISVVIFSATKKKGAKIPQNQDVYTDIGQYNPQNYYGVYGGTYDAYYQRPWNR